MRKTILILLLALWPALAHAQSITTVASALKGGANLPTKCRPATSGSKADVFIKTGSGAGLKYCDSADHWADVGGGSGSGDLVGPSSATDNAVARFDGTTGKLVQDSAVTIADTTGDITAGKYNKVAITAPATGSTLTILNGKTLTANNTLTLAGTDSTVMTFPGASDTLAGLGTAQTFSAAQGFSNTVALTSTTAANNKITQGAAINIGSTSTDGIVLQNTTAAAAGAQQWSPRLHWIGQGWKTNATAASQTVDYIAELVPVQGAANPTANLQFSYQVNGGGYTAGLLMNTAGQIIAPAGTQPSYAVGGLSNYGVGYNSGLAFYGNGNVTVYNNGTTEWRYGSSQNFTWSSAANPVGTGGDIGLHRLTTGVLRVTNGNTTGVAGNFHVAPSTLTNAAQLHVGVSNATTSTITTGQIIEQLTSGTPAAGFGTRLYFKLQSSTTASQDAALQNVYWGDATHATRGSVYTLQTTSNAATSERIVVAPRKALTNNSATSIFDATLASGSAVGGTIEATIYSSDGTDFQTRSAVITYQAVNKAGTITSSVTVASETAAVSSGTLTGTWAVTNGSGKITITLNANSSLTPTSHYVVYRIHPNSEQAVTAL